MADPGLLEWVRLIPILFFLIALVYSSVGLGGGSSYTALMATAALSLYGVSGFTPQTIPMYSLILNLSVTLIGSYHFLIHRHGRLRIILPFLITSIPMAYVGGSLHLSPDLFYRILLLSLVAVAIRIYFWEIPSLSWDPPPVFKTLLCLGLGGILGWVAGVVGIGGGIYLVPLIIILKLGNEKEAAACGSVFIWINSLAGLSARWQYQPLETGEWMGFLPMLLAVGLGGYIGSRGGATMLSPRSLERILGVVILVAIYFLARRVFAGLGL